MPGPIIKIRARFFVAVEGESEQSFVKWLQLLSSEKSLHIHLDSFPLCGGGFKKMLAKAARRHKQNCRIAPYQDQFLIVDRDRAEQVDCSIEELKREAAKHQFTVCVQN